MVFAKIKVTIPFLRSGYGVLDAFKLIMPIIIGNFVKC